MTKQVCAVCNTTLVRTKFVGYYESFEYWACECKDLADYKLNVGAYGSINVEDKDLDLMEQN